MDHKDHQEDTVVALDPPKSHPLRALVSSIQILADTVNSENPHIQITQFVQTCRLFHIINVEQLVFAYNELNDKVKGIERGSRSGETLEDLIKREVADGTAEWAPSPSRNIVRMKRTIDLFRIFFELVLENEDSDSLYDPITNAYEEVFGPYHFQNARVSVQTALKLHLPNKTTFWEMINEDGNSVKEPLENFIVAAKVVVPYIESVFQSSEMGVEILDLI